MENLNISREIKEKLDNFIQLLIRWNERINLISRGELPNLWTRHIADSLQLLKYINYNMHVIDIGSGNGIPALILAIAGIQNITIVESNRKKITFLKQASLNLSNNINIINDRVENLVLEGDILISRAFASIDQIFRLTKNYKIYNKYLLLKGVNYLSEIEKAKHNWSFDYRVFTSVTSNNGNILEIRNIKNVI